MLQGGYAITLAAVRGGQPLAFTLERKPMAAINTFISCERRAVFLGLLSFLVLVFLLPLIATVVASLGPIEWVTQYLAPAKRYQSVLFVLVGAIVAWQSTRAPITNTIVVGLAGGLGLLAFAAYFGASPHLGVAAHFFWYVIVTVGWCLLGGLGVSLLRRNQHAP